MREARKPVDPARLRAALASPEQPDTVDVRETHISWVFLAGQRAYKLKKPLVLPFLDYGTPGRRLEMCREEVRLNRRLAADIYLGVLAVAETPHDLELTSAEDPRAIDYLVEMRRYEERNTLAAALDRGRVEARADRPAGAHSGLLPRRVLASHRRPGWGGAHRT